MRINSTNVVLGVMGVAAAAMIAVPLLNAGSDGKPDAAPSPTTSVSASPTATPVPTSTIKPNTVTVDQALTNAVNAYATALNEKGGVLETVFASNGYATQAQLAPSGDTLSDTGSPTIPQVVRIGATTYAQLAGAELTNSERLRTKVGKPGAVWTTDTSKIDPIVNQWLYPVNLTTAYKGLSPGITLGDMLTQPDGTTIITADLTPEKVTDASARAAFKLPDPATPSTKGQYTVQFGLDPAGVLTRMVVNVPANPTQIVVKSFQTVAISAPPADKVITPEDVAKALAATPAPTTPAQ